MYGIDTAHTAIADPRELSRRATRRARRAEAHNVMRREAWAVRCGVCLLVASLSLPHLLASQGPLTTQREFVLPTPGLGVGNAVIELRGGGFAAVGYGDFGGPTGTDVLLVRFDPAGDTLWTRSYGSGREDFGWDVVEAQDGGFFLVGYTEAPTEGREDVLVLRVDAVGARLWQRTYGEAGRDRAWSAVLAEDGGIVIAAESESMEHGGRDAYLLHIGSDGTARWIRRVDVPGDQRVYHVAKTDDGAFVATGTTAEHPDTTRDAYVVRVAADGDVVWTRSFGGAPDDVGHGVMALDSGDVLVTGYGATRSHGGTDVYFLRLDAVGNLRWWRYDGGVEDDRAMMSAPDLHGGFVSVGFSFRPTGPDIVVLEVDRDGTVKTRTVLERPGVDRGVMIVAPRGGGYVLTGTLGHADASPGDFAVLWLASTGPSR